MEKGKMNKELAISILCGNVLGTNEQTHEAVFMAIKALEAEPVIRCKDCYFCGEIDENGWHCCENLGVGMPKNGFCSDAERKEVG